MTNHLISGYNCVLLCLVSSVCRSDQNVQLWSEEEMYCSNIRASSIGRGAQCKWETVNFVANCEEKVAKKIWRQYSILVLHVVQRNKNHRNKTNDFSKWCDSHCSGVFSLGCFVIEQERRNLGNYTRSWVLECSHDSGSEAGTNGIVSLHSMFNCSWQESILNNIPINA